MKDSNGKIEKRLDEEWRGGMGVDSNDNWVSDNKEILYKESEESWKPVDQSEIEDW